MNIALLAATLAIVPVAHSEVPRERVCKEHFGGMDKCNVLPNGNVMIGCWQGYQVFARKDIAKPNPRPIISTCK